MNTLEMLIEKYGLTNRNENRTSTFEGINIFQLDIEQIEVIKKNIETAQNALDADLATVAYNEIVANALSRGIIDKSYTTVRHGQVPKYSGEAMIVINNRTYLAIGHGPRGTAEWIEKDGEIELIPQDLPANVDAQSLSEEQRAMFKMSKRELSTVKRKVLLAEKSLTTDFNELSAAELESLALAHGISDISYTTVRHGRVPKYAGSAIVTIKGKQYRATGYGPKGDAYGIDKDGYISWEPVVTETVTQS